MMSKGFRNKAVAALFIILFFTLITELPFKEAQASTTKNYRPSSFNDDGYTYSIIIPQPFPQLPKITEYFQDNENHILMLSTTSATYNWFRFPNVDVPQGAMIESATLYVRAFADNPATIITSKIQGFDEDNAASPTGYTDWINRPKTQASQEVYLGEFEENSLYSYSGLESIIQEIVDRPGWSSDNSLVICSNTSSLGDSPISCYSWEGANDFGDPLYAPSLSITYVPAVLESPTASFTYSTEDQTVSFDASDSSDSDGIITTYQWDFGDASTGTGMTASHTYASATTYTVKLTVTDSDGLTDEIEKIITITRQPSSLSCTLSSTQIIEGDSITITGSITPPLTGRNVTLTYQPPSGSASTRMVTTDSNSEYSDTYMPSTLGSWMVTASWGGDATYIEASSATRIFTVSSVPEAPPCIIATATFGSELTPQVQLLRSFRDYRILSTFAGSQFMTVFNSFYYSFSPDVADLIRGNDALRDMMKVALYPLINVLQVSEGIFSVLSFSPELAVVTTGFVASALIAVIYLLPLTLIISYFRKVPFLKNLFRAVGMVWLVSLTSIVVAEVSQSSVLMMTATGTFVLASMGLTIVSLLIVLPTVFHKISDFAVPRLRVNRK